MGTAALEQQPTVFSSSALSFDYPLLPSSTSLPAYKQWFVCLPVAFGFNTRKLDSQRAMCMHLCMHMSISITDALVPVHAYTEAWPCVYKLFCFHPCGRIRHHIPSSKHTAALSNESPLSSASALGYSSFHALPNGFSNAGTRFLSRLDRHFPLCLEMGIRHWVVRWWWCCWKILHTEQKHFPWTCMKRPNVRLHAHFHICPNKCNKSNSEILLSFSLYSVFVVCFWM